MAVPGQRVDPIVCHSGADGFPGAGLQVQMLLPHQRLALPLLFPTTLPILIPLLLRGHQGKSEILCWQHFTKSTFEISKHQNVDVAKL